MARLARLEVSDDRVDQMAAELGAIIEHMGAISRWEGEEAADGPSALRRTDTVVKPDTAELASAAARHQDGHVVVPPIKGAS